MWCEPKVAGTRNFDWLTFRGPTAILLLHSRYVRVDAHSMQPVNYVRTHRASSRPREIMARWMRNGERGGTFRYATLTGDRFFSPIRHSTPLMTTLDSARGAARRFFFFFFFFSFLSFSFETVTQQSSILRLRCAALNLNYYARKEFSCLPAFTLRLSRESLQLPIIMYTILGAFYSLQGRFHSGFLFILLSYFSCLPAPETTWKSPQCRQELSKFLRMYRCMNHRR